MREVSSFSASRYKYYVEPGFSRISPQSGRSRFNIKSERKIRLRDRVPDVSPLLQQLAHAVENGVFIFPEVFGRHADGYIRLHTTPFQAHTLRSMVVQGWEMDGEPTWQLIIRRTQHLATRRLANDDSSSRFRTVLAKISAPLWLR